MSQPHEISDVKTTTKGLVCGLARATGSAGSKKRILKHAVIVTQNFPAWVSKEPMTWNVIHVDGNIRCTGGPIRIATKAEAMREARAARRRLRRMGIAVYSRLGQVLPNVASETRRTGLPPSP